MTEDRSTVGLKRCLLTHLNHITRDRNPYLASAGHFYVREYIRQELGQWGTVIRDEFLVRGNIHQNLILTLPAKNSSVQKTPLLIGAHYDTVPGTSGADDNATGVAVLLELAKAIATNPLTYPVQSIAFDMEEYGLLGSRHYATQLQKNQQKLRLMISLEMLGYCDPHPGSQRYPMGLKYFYPNCGNFIALIGNLRTIPDMVNFKLSFRKSGTPCEWLPIPQKGIILPDTRRSDHASFWDCNYPAILITDTANLRNPHYHQATDTIATLNLDFLTQVCQSLILALHNL